QRRISHIQLLEPSERGAVAHVLGVWDRPNDRFGINKEPAAWEALSQRTGLVGRRQDEEIEDRAAVLTGLLEQGVTDYDAVRAAILRWYGDA
ncbi:MAG: hypothetical protein NTZ05_11450, partial [Chloroflexi bacterium]|nr:hypothetical protein [Chloroflexota bacterium]